MAVFVSAEGWRLLGLSYTSPGKQPRTGVRSSKATARRSSWIGRAISLKARHSITTPALLTQGFVFHTRTRSRPAVCGSSFGA